MMIMMADDDPYDDDHDDYCIDISALTHLDYVKLWGKQLELSLSKFRTVQMPKDDQPVSYDFYIINILDFCRRLCLCLNRCGCWINL